MKQTERTDLRREQVELQRLQARSRRLERRVAATFRDRLREVLDGVYGLREAEQLLSEVRRLTDSEPSR